MQQTTVSADSPVMTVKGSTTPVQVANAEFYVDPTTGLFRTRTPAGSASNGARHLLQEVDPAARIASADFNLHSSGMMLSSNVFSKPSLFSSSFAAAGDSDNTSASSAGGLRRLLDTTTDTPTAVTVSPPICDWASTDLFDINSCTTLTVSGTVSMKNATSITVPQYAGCQTMQGVCQNFGYSVKVSFPMWMERYGTAGNPWSGYPFAGRMCVCSFALSHACILTLNFS